MTYLCVTWRQPGTRVRAVIIIIVYVVAFRLAPTMAVSLAIGGLLAAWLLAVPGQPRIITSGIAR